MTTPTLFDDPPAGERPAPATPQRSARRVPATPRARNTDPDTSKQAARLAKLTFKPQAARVLAALLETERNGGHGATAHEVCLVMAYGPRPAPQRNVASKRLSELAALGLVVDSGDRRTDGCGQPAIVWVSTVAGRERAEVVEQ